MEDISDWEVVNESNEPSSNEKISNIGDWEIVPEQNESSTNKESFGKSAALAIPRIGTDIVKNLYHGIQNIPGYYEASKTEVPGGANVIMHHPLNALKQLGAGLAEFGHGALNMRPEFYKYLENRLNLIPHGTANLIAPGQPDIEPQINALLGAPSQPGEKLLRGIGRNAPNLLGGVALSPSLNIPTRAGIKNAILNAHDVLENKAAQGFSKVSNEVEKRGINKLDLSKEPINFEELKHYFPRTKQVNSLLEKAQSGDYNALRKLQSDIYTRGKKNLGSSLEADRMKGAEMLEKREEINNAISNHLIKTGHHDLNDILNAARKDYHTLQKIYYNENMNPAIIKMVDKNYRKIPKNLVNVLAEESKPMQELRNFHPGLESSIGKYNFNKNALNKITKYGVVPALFGAGLGLGGYGAYKALSPDNSIPK